MVKLVPVEQTEKRKFRLVPVDGAMINDRVAQAHEMPDQTIQQDPLLARTQGTFSGITDMAKSGLMLGLDDEVKAGMIAPIDAAKSYFQGNGFNLGDAYDARQKQFDAEKKGFRSQNPISSGVAEIAGGLATGGGLAKAGLTLAGKATSTLGRIGGAVAEGAAYGGVYGAGDASQGERLEGAAKGAAIGAITGGLAEGAVTAMVRRKVLKETIPQSTDLKAASQSLYKQAEQAKVAMPQPVFGRMVANMKNGAGRINEKLHPKAAGAIEVLEAELAKGRNPSLQDIDDVRRILSGAAQKADPDDQRILINMVDRMDKFIDNAAPNALTGNKQGVQYWREAQSLWKKKAKAEVVEEIMEKARNQATGFENGMRVQFRALANNKKKFNKFTEAERNAITRIVRGAPLENTLRAIGWLSPTGVFGALTTGAVGVGSLGGGAALAGTGFVARKGAEALTRGNVNALDRTIKLGTSQIALPSSKASPFLGAGSIAGQGLYPSQQKSR